MNFHSVVNSINSSYSCVAELSIRKFSIPGIPNSEKEIQEKRKKVSILQISGIQKMRNKFKNNL